MGPSSPLATMIWIHSVDAWIINDHPTWHCTPMDDDGGPWNTPGSTHLTTIYDLARVWLSLGTWDSSLAKLGTFSSKNFAT
jgi:hypothetical protein